MTQFLKTYDEITAWLNRMGVRNYQITPDKKYGFMVDVMGKVRICDKKMVLIPVKFNVVKGSFSCHNNQLTSLAGAPNEVMGFFNCGKNQLTNLLGGPKKVQDHYFCHENKLTSLEGAPKSVGGDFECDNNEIENFEFCPHRVSGTFNWDNNPLLGDNQLIRDFNQIKKIHQNYVDIKNEKQMMEKSVEGDRKRCIKSFKI